MLSAVALTLGLFLAAPPPAAPAPSTPPAAASAAAKKKVAVLPFDVAKGMDATLGKTFSGALLGEIRKLRGNDVNIMAPDDVVQALPEPLRNRLKRCQMATCKAQMAQAVGADRALGGDISKVGSTVVLNLAVLEAADGAQVSQWTGKAPADSIDKLLDQLPAAVGVLFPAPTPPPAPAPAPTPAPVAAAPAPPPPQPAVAPLLPSEEFLPMPAPEPTPPPPSSTTVTAQPDVAPPPPSTTPPPPVEEPGWSRSFIGGAFGIGVPAGIAAVVFIAAAAVGTGVSIASHIVAFNINREIKAVPHKEEARSTGIPVYPYDLSALIWTGRATETLAYVGYGLAVLSVLFAVVAAVIGIGGAASMIYSARPKEDPAKGIKPRSQP